MKKIELREQQLLELEILRAFSKLCEENGLSYSLACGTLLGAIRHKGFIPWDDDIDVMMPRMDYIKFLDICETIEWPYKCVYPNTKSFRIDNIYPYNYAKIIDCRTELIESPKTLNYKTGIYIDIFPIDGYPSIDSRLIKRNGYIKKIIVINFLLNSSFYKTKVYKFSFKGIVFSLLLILKYIFPNALYKLLEKECMKYDFATSKYSVIFSGGCGNREYILKDLFFPLIDVSFEGYTFKAIYGYDLFLRNCYGDYMSLPPIEEQRKYHDNYAFWKNEFKV